jgi:ABC-type oligopeptide transport system substrate-binding subunit
VQTNRIILAIFGIMGALVLAIAVLVVVLVAGGGGGESSGAQTGGEATPTAGEEDGGGPSSGELRLLGPEPITLDPHITQDAGSALYIVEIFGGLLTLDPELNLQPDLAVEIPTEENGGKVVNPDGTVTYTFRLREDALFHDRRPVRAGGGRPGWLDASPQRDRPLQAAGVALRRADHPRSERPLSPRGTEGADGAVLAQRERPHAL